jgi:uncharacterized protein YndB with AHSA1/START domain
MTQQMTDAPVRQSITVEAPVERAFTVFTEGFDSWWPREHHIGSADMQRAIMEAEQGGRWYEQGVDGSECGWGQVLVWEPPHRLVLAWQISAEWQYEPDLARSSEIEVRFTAETPSRTRVELEHRGFERHGPGAAGIRTSVSGEGGWPDLMTRYAATVAA